MRIAIVGYGRMGREVERLASRAGFSVVAVVRSRSDWEGRLDIVNAEVAIEFTHPDSALPNIRRLAEAGIDIVCGTTGWYDHMDEARRIVEEAGVGLVYAPNFSTGALLIFDTLRRLAPHLSRLKAEVGVFEVHHSAKKDAPSGTAKRMAEILQNSSLNTPVSWLRVGGVVGWHLFLADLGDESIEVHHRVRSRSAFARGALLAAQLVRGKKGLFSFQQLLTDFLNADDN